MHAERDWLRNHVLPVLEERLRARQHHLETIDLRCGVDTESLDATSEQAREFQVLKVCLDEIERSRPFLIGLIGDRYGWLPPADRRPALTDLSPQERHRALDRLRRSVGRVAGPALSLLSLRSTAL